MLYYSDTLMIAPCEPEQVGILSVIVAYKYLRNKYVHFVG